MNPKKLLGQINDGLFRQNPIFIQTLGMCPALATSTTVINGLGMGLATAVALVFSNLFISLFRRIIPKQVRIAAYIVMISGLVTALEIFMDAYIPSLNKSLGVFIPLIVVNCIILARAEAFASKRGPFVSMLDGLFMGLGFTLAIFILASVREVIGAGTFADIQVMPEAYTPALMFALPPGAFITLGIVIAGFKKIVSAVTKERGK